MTYHYHQDITDAIENDSAPRFSFAAVEHRALRQRSAGRSHKRYILLAALLVGLPCLAVATGLEPAPAIRQAILTQLRHWNVFVPGPTVFEMSTAVDPRDAMRIAEFRLVLPFGLPPDAKLVDFEQNSAGKTSYSATYRIASGHKAWFILQKKVAGHAYVPWFAVGRTSDDDNSIKLVRYPARVWFVGDEVVTAASDGLTAAQLRAIESAMDGRDAPLHRGLVLVR